MKKVLTAFLLVLCPGTFAAVRACTTAVISASSSANGRPMLWKQRDSGVMYNYVDHFPATDSTFAFTGIVNTEDEARASVWSGANSEGFAIMNSMSYGLSPLVSEDRPWEGTIMKKALGICRTVDDFEAYIKSLPQPNGLEANFGVIDAEGGAAYFEVHDFGYARFDASDAPGGYLVRSNFSLTGREGEGKGYDRYEIADSAMRSRGGGFTAEWILDSLARNPVICRETTVSSTVIEGVGPADPKGSSLIWTIPGYPLAAYAIASWVEAGDRIAPPLKSSRRGSSLNELSKELQQKGVSDEITSRMRKLEKEEFSRGRRLDSLVRSGKVRASDFDAFNTYTPIL